MWSLASERQSLDMTHKYTCEFDKPQCATTFRFTIQMYLKNVGAGKMAILRIKNSEICREKISLKGVSIMFDRPQIENKLIFHPAQRVRTLTTVYQVGKFSKHRL